MLKAIHLLFFFLLSFLSYAQNNYPIQTVLKGDSVVIYTVEQNNDIELLLANQRNRVSYFKNNIVKQEEIIDSLNKLIGELSQKKKLIVDSLQLVLNTNFSDYDSLHAQYRDVEKWLYNAAVDHAYIYYSYNQRAIMSIDLTSYVLVGYKRSGNFSLVRRGPVSDDKYWKQYNRACLDEPNAEWLTSYKIRWRPSLVQFPYQIDPQP
jgi:hypothetical protein